MRIKWKRKLRKKNQALTAIVIEQLRGFAPIRLFLKSRRAVSPVISNLILIAAVIVVGMVALGYARYNSSNYQTQYQQTVNSDIDKLREVIAFEYVHYDSNLDKLFIYFMNAGEIGNVNVTSAFISIPQNFDNFQIKNFGGQIVSALDIGEEGYIVLEDVEGLNGEYILKLTTQRDSIFAQSFTA